MSDRFITSLVASSTHSQYHSWSESFGLNFQLTFLSSLSGRPKKCPAYRAKTGVMKLQGHLLRVMVVQTTYPFHSVGQQTYAQPYTFPVTETFISTTIRALRGRQHTMVKLLHRLVNFARRESGVTGIEYALLASLIALSMR